MSQQLSMSKPASSAALVSAPGWDLLRHGGLLLDPPRLREVAHFAPAPLSAYTERELRKRLASVLDDGADISEFIAFMLEHVCGFDPQAQGQWLRGSSVSAEYGHKAITGETVKPRHLWSGPNGAELPVFIDAEKRVGIGRGRRATSNVVQWLRAHRRRLALLTNGRQCRLIFAGLDFDAYCEAEAELFFEEGGPAPQLEALRTLIQPALWVPAEPDATPALERAILDSRKGQAELSAVLGERVREAVELLVQAHGDVLAERAREIAPADIYRAAVRMIMRMVVVLFAESRELLPRENALYHGSYGLSGLLEELEKSAHRSGSRLARSHAAWPRVLSLFRLVYCGSFHPRVLVPEYGGELFAPGDPTSADGLTRALAIFESACFDRELVTDREVHRILELITRTKVKIRQGRSSMWVPAPVDFSDLSSEYIGILYEGLLDFELKQAPPGDPVVFLAVGNAPALPLSRLEAMDDRAIEALLESLKDSGGLDAGAEDEALAEDDAVAEDDALADNDVVTEDDTDGDDENAAGEDAPDLDSRRTTLLRAQAWAHRAVIAGKLMKAPRGTLTPERRLAHEAAIDARARQLLDKRGVVLPGEWYVVRWGGTRKGSGTFYTRPGLAVPTVQRTLRPLAYNPPTHADGSPSTDAPPVTWKPKLPEEILALKVLDPACGSGTFPVAALRFLTEALYESLLYHDRISDDPAAERAIVHLIQPPAGAGVPEERLGQELVPCRTSAAEFEPRLKALLRRHVVERCIYGVDLDPLAVELARLSLWIETMDRSLPFSFLDHKVKCGNSLVGAWFDTFRHYPVMAFKNREGGDKGHTNGVHCEKDARGRALKEFASATLKSDLADFITGQLRTFDAVTGVNPATVHDEALATLARLHDLPVHDTAERARIYRAELIGSPAYQQLKDAMDLWCACWFWPAGELDRAPLPTTLAKPAGETLQIVRRIAAEKRFFHWELEFPDVFREAGSGFDGVLGNPPWDIAKPNSKEYFSNVDPLYRSYGKQDALRRQSEYFASETEERAWLNYNADFRAQSNFMKYAACPFGDPKDAEDGGERYAISRGRENDALHERWRATRAKGHGYADAAHPFRHQGSADINLYKLFLETAHALLRRNGRLGFIVPSGLYSDHGTGGLRELFLDRCRWEWLFSLENHDGIFDIHRSFKFNPVVIQKGGRTEAIRTAFMRRALEDWERAEELAVPYSRQQVERFSPKSRAILEIQSARDLEILEKIYANSVLLGDDGPDGWGVTYAREFDMTNDSKLFPPRPAWEAKGYRPDEYSRWLLGAWRPIDELWAELGMDPSRVVPAEVELEDWLFDTTAGPERRTAEAQFVHGHLLKPGDVARTPWRLRCAQPPYDALPIPRADIPPGIVLSREGDAWVQEREVEDVALPLYEGRMIGQFDFSQKGWVSGKGRSAVWREIPWDRKQIEPQYLMAAEAYRDDASDSRGAWWRARTAFMDITSATNARTSIATVVSANPCGNSVPVLDSDAPIPLAAVMSSFAFDFVARRRLTGLHLNYFILDELPLPIARLSVEAERLASTALAADRTLAIASLESSMHRGESVAAVRLTTAARLAARCALDAVVFAAFGLSTEDVRRILLGDMSRAKEDDPTGFHRIDQDKDLQLRQTLLTVAAFCDLEKRIRDCGGNRDCGIEMFLGQNEGEGWMLPETLQLADYGLGHDDRAKHPQTVARRLGPRFYDWQLAQGAEESWRECHLHARNVLGEQGYQELLDEIAARNRGEEPERVQELPASLLEDAHQGSLW